MMRVFFALFFILSGAALSHGETVIKSHALSLTESVMYPPDFSHYRYANPEAPKGGLYRTYMTRPFDNFNVYALKGNTFSVLSITGNMLNDSLMTPSGDEAATYYGLIAESVEYPESKKWIIFNINKKARWHDGRPITARDVYFTYKASSEANPIFKSRYSFVTKAEVLSDSRIRFYIGGSELPLRNMVTLAQMVVIPEHYWKDRDLSQSTMEPPLQSGPYKIASFEPGKRVVLERVKDYWAAELPVCKGLYNFDRITYDLYRDQTMALEAFKGGRLDTMMVIHSSRVWSKGVAGKYVDMGYIKKISVPNLHPMGMAGILMNTSRAPLDNILVRKALNYAYDWEWINKNVYFGGEIRNDSYFARSDLACGAVPPPEVAAIIKSVKPDADEKLLTEEFRLPETGGTGDNRANLMEGVKLLEKAGYKMVNGRMTDGGGKPLNLEITVMSKNNENELLSFKKNLERMGVGFDIRYVDSSSYVEKKAGKDFMMIYDLVKPPFYPGKEQKDMWTSAAADTPGSRNYWRIKDPAVDKLVDMIVNAPDRKTAVNYVKALDRLLLEGWYSIPGGYSGTFRSAYWDKFGMPRTMPKNSTGLDSWWVDPEKEARLKSFLK